MKRAMLIKKFADTIEAEEKLLKLDHEYSLEFHQLKKGEIVELHSHTFPELIFIEKGKCAIAVPAGNREIKADKCVVTVYIPKNMPHLLKALSNLTYRVIKDKNQK